VVRPVNTRDRVPWCSMAMRGLQAHAVPSARAGQRPDPSARRDVLSGLLAVGFLLGIIGVVVLIVIGAPEYAEPASGNDADTAALVAGASPSPGSSLAPEASAWPSPTSPEPEALKGYRWPVRGGQVEQYYDRAQDGRFSIDEKPVHAGLVITWFDGAPVKAAHKGTVVVAGRGWEREAGYVGLLDAVYAKLKAAGQKPTEGVVVDDGNGYFSIYSGLKDLAVKEGQEVTPATTIGLMSLTERRYMVRYQLLRGDGYPMKVALKSRKQGYPYYAHEYVDPLRVLKLDAAVKPRTTSPKPPKRPPVLEPPR
jgi:murein DD-endopeptidase MepM/ murein hydrolase activator NlpD